MPNHVRVTMYEGDKEPIHVQLEYTADELRTTDDTLVQIAVGDITCRGSVTVPFEVLTALVSRVAEARAQRSPAIVMPPREIVLPRRR